MTKTQYGPLLSEEEWTSVKEIISGLSSDQPHAEFMAALKVEVNLRELSEHLERLQAPASNVRIRLRPGNKTVIETICLAPHFRDTHTFRSSGLPNLRSMILQASLEMDPHEVRRIPGEGASESPMILELSERQLITLWVHAALSDQEFVDGTGRVPLGPYCVDATLHFGQREGLYTLRNA